MPIIAIQRAVDGAPPAVVEPACYRDLVRPEWIDYNGHLSEPYYVLVFGDAYDGADGPDRARR